MPRIARSALGGMVYHVIRRANGRFRLFTTEGHYAAFQKAMSKTRKRVSHGGKGRKSGMKGRVPFTYAADLRE